MGYITFALVSNIPLYMSLVQKTCTRGILTHNPLWLSHYDQSYPGVCVIVPILPISHFIHQGVLGTNYIPDRWHYIFYRCLITSPQNLTPEWLWTVYTSGFNTRTILYHAYKWYTRATLNRVCKFLQQSSSQLRYIDSYKNVGDRVC